MTTSFARAEEASLRLKQVRRSLRRSWLLLWTLMMFVFISAAAGLYTDYLVAKRSVAMKTMLVADGTTQTLALALDGVRAEVRNLAIFMGAQQRRLTVDEALLRQAGQGGAGHFLVITNSLGRVIATSAPERLPRGTNFFREAFFRIHWREAPAAEYIGVPHPEYGLPISHAIRGEKGQAIGAVIAFLGASVVGSLLPPEWSAEDNLHVAVHFDGRLLAISPARPDWQGWDAANASPALYNEATRGNHTGAWGPLGEGYYVAYNRLAPWPLVVEAGVPIKIAFASFIRSAWVWGGLALLALIGLFLGGRYLIHQKRRQLIYTAVVERKNKDLRRANAIKTEFLAHMSHELRTPLNAVIGFAETLSAGVMGPLTDKQKEYADDIGTAGRHLLGLVNDLLDLSVIDSGKLQLREETVNLADIIGKAERLTQSIASKAGLTLVCEIAPQLPPILADARKLEQILLNLIGNAIKFTPAGGRITVRAARELETLGLVVAVTDTGRGIATADIPLVLSPFGRVEAASRHAQDGAGLGLPISQRLVELHQGRLTITSHPGQGTTVKIHLPASRIRKE